MKAIVFTAPNENLSLIEKEKPIPNENQVLVQVKSASLNHRDLWITKGLYPNLKANTTLGSCASGVVDGQDVIINPNLHWGDDPNYPNHKTYSILGMPADGTFAEYIVVNKDRIAKKPVHLSYNEAAALPLAGLTAYRALFTKGEITPNKKVLISGIGGGVAQMAFLFAKAVGAEVYVTSGADEKIERAKQLGATGGVNYKNKGWSKDFKQQFDNVDIIIDSAGGAGYGEFLKICNPNARIVNYGGTRGECSFNPQLLFWKELHLLGSTMGNDQEFHDMVSFVEKHKITPIVDQTFAMQDYQKAMDKMDSGKQFGKIVMEVG